MGSEYRIDSICPHSWSRGLPPAKDPSHSKVLAEKSTIVSAHPSLSTTEQLVIKKEADEKALEDQQTQQQLQQNATSTTANRRAMEQLATAARHCKKHDNKEHSTYGPPQQQSFGKQSLSDDISNCYDTDDDSYYAEFGFLFESHQPVRVETYQWENLQVRLTVPDDDIPGCIQSGLYVWPAARELATYIVRSLADTSVLSVVELGAGCGLVSLTAWQVWKHSLQCLVVTDHDANTLARARDNLESTMQCLINQAQDNDELLNVVINSLASIPVAFDSLEWGESVDSILLNHIQEHSQFSQAHMILGSDLIHDQCVIQPLLQTVQKLMARTGSFYLAQSIALTPEAEEEMSRVCSELMLARKQVSSTGIEFSE